MTTLNPLAPNSDLDLVLERVVDVPPELVWAAWTEPKHLTKWFAPAPMSVARATVELFPGGTFEVVMRTPEGEEWEGPGCILEVTEGRRLVWTDALLPGFRPKEGGFFTAVITIEPEGKGTRYTARAVHKSAEDRQKHDEMGFLKGWEICLNQLVAVMKDG